MFAMNTHTHSPSTPTIPQVQLGARLVDASGARLPRVGAELTASASGGQAKITLRHAFHNLGDVPLRVSYQVPLPSDASVGQGGQGGL